MTTAEQQADDRYLIRKRGAFYRPNAEGYTNNRAEAGRYTLAQAIWHSHPNGPNGPRDGIDYVVADEPAAPCLASVSSASAEGDGQDRKFAFRNGQFVNRVSGEPVPHDEPVIIFRARDNHSLPVLREYLTMASDPHHRQAIKDRMGEFAAWRAEHPDRVKEPGITHHIRLNHTPEPVPATNQAGEVATPLPCPFCGENLMCDPNEGAPFWVHRNRLKSECWLADSWVKDEMDGEGGIREWNTRAALATQPATSQEVHNG